MPSEAWRNDSLGQMVMIESTKRMSQALERLRLFKMWSWQDAVDFVTVAVWDVQEQEAFLNLIRASQATGAASPSVGIKNFEDKLRIATAHSFHIADRIGGITGLGTMVFEPNGGLRTWRIYNPSILTANLEERGNFARINGVPGTGKTNTGCVISEHFASLPSHVSIGNVRMLKPDPRFIYAKDARALFESIANLPYDVTWGFTHDEGGLSYSKPDQATRRVKDLDKLMRCVRKLGGSYILIEQREDSVPNIIIEFAKNIFYTEAKGIVSIEMRGPNLAFRDTVKDFPKTTLPFDTDDIAMFDVNVDIQKLFTAISGSGDPKGSLREFLASETKGPKERVCAKPGCGIAFISDDHRVRYCETHRRYYDGAHYSADKRTERETTKKESLDEFLSEP